MMTADAGPRGAVSLGVGAATPGAESISSELDRILSSPRFVHCERLGRFLRFVVEQTLGNREASLKQYTVGIEVFDKTEDFDPRIDPIVRVEARRLRARLKKYYETDGRNDPVEIELPARRYAPVFRGRLISQPPTSLRPQPGSTGVALAVRPFASLYGAPGIGYFADGLTEELTCALAKVEGLRAVSWSTGPPRGKGARSAQEAVSQIDTGAVLEGSVRKSGRRVRITALLVNCADGAYLWAETYERELRNVFAVQAEVAQAIAGAVKRLLVG